MGEEKSFSQRAFSIYTDIRKLQDKAKTSCILDDDTYGFGGSYLLERDKYTDKVQKAVDLYKNAQLYTQLKKKWNDLTGTDSPYMWSNKYHMPIYMSRAELEEIEATRAIKKQKNRQKWQQRSKM